mmetsp:Transcript_108170/g.187838  ORF Transcript_108170/g.187838 Transcript_108170/m.187838 type:complete len:364 (+) Transcript_108170:102-1193(+)
MTCQMDRSPMLLVVITVSVLVPRRQFVAQAMREDPSDTDGSLELSGAQQQLASGAAQPRTAVCVKNTGRPCQQWREGTIVDRVMQCRRGGGSRFSSFRPAAENGTAKATCSVDEGSPQSAEGVCMCEPGYCADSDLKCHSEEYKMLPSIFTITTKVSGPQDILYMEADGTVKLGTPSDPRAGQWRISVTQKGVKILTTEMYLQSVLQEYESCTSKTNEMIALTWSSCELIVGHVQEPRADEMGWFIEAARKDNFNVPDGGQLDQFNSDGDYVNLRSAKSGDVFYVNPNTKTTRACQSTSTACPGDHGALRFDPPLIGRGDFKLDEAGTGLPPGIRTFIISAGVFCSLVLVLCVIHFGARLRKK